MITRWLLVDDQPVEARNCAALLTLPEQFEVTSVEPETDTSFLLSTLTQAEFDGVLIDHALNDAKPEIKYPGSTLAALVRSDSPPLPIVALSARLRDREELLRYGRTKELFDWVVDKQELQLHANSIRQRLKVLGDGYRTLRKVLSSGNTSEVQKACTILGIPEDLEEDAERTLVARLLLERGAGDPSHFAHFLLQVALGLPGPLLDWRRGAVAAGVAPNEPSTIMDFLTPAAYQGVFAGFHGDGRFWREQLGELHASVAGLAPARCLACGEEARELCERCRRPVDGIHSLPVRRKEVAHDVFLRGRLCGICLAGEIPDELSLDGRYVSLRAALVAEVKHLENHVRERTR